MLHVVLTPFTRLRANSDHKVTDFDFSAIRAELQLQRELSASVGQEDEQQQPSRGWISWAQQYAEQINMRIACKCV